jgi:hypothetical protein
MGRVIVVSNRLPVTVTFAKGAPVLAKSSGGLVSIATGLSELGVGSFGLSCLLSLPPLH